MEGPKIVLAIVVTLSLLQVGGSSKLKDTNANIGGGDCVTHEDCSNNGVCNQEKPDKATCDCFLGFTGANCDVEKKIEIGEPLKPLGKSTKSGRKRGHVNRHHYENATRRTLEYDTKSNLLGLLPEVLADKQQPFLIYCPEKKNFVFVSKDIKATGKRSSHNNYVQAREGRDGERNLFLLEKAGAKVGDVQQYFIKNIKMNRYLYVSNSKSGAINYWNNNVLAAEEKPTSGDSIKKFKFQFEDYEKDGFYTIKNDDKSLYVSSQPWGIPTGWMVKATKQKELERWDSRFFQFSLKYDATDIKLEIEGEPKGDTKLTLANTGNKCYCNQGKEGVDKDFSNEFTYEEGNVYTKTYTKTDGFTLATTVNPPKVAMFSTTFTYSHTEQEQDSKQETTKTTVKTAVTTAVNRCTCVYLKYQYMAYDQPYKITAKSKENKVLEATGVIKGQREWDHAATQKNYPYKDKFKCPESNVECP